MEGRGQTLTQAPKLEAATLGPASFFREWGGLVKGEGRAAWTPVLGYRPFVLHCPG